MHLRKNAKIEMLRKVPLFEQCSRRELDEIAGVADELQLAEGRELTREGARGREFFVVIDGELEVRRRARKVATLGGGDFVGEMALVTGRPRNATVTTKSTVRALVITDRAFSRLLASSPTIQLKIMKALADRVPDAGH
ncbi:MAG: cyclic nucleotide-binding domain-containing protein [Actinobacteria bacterium]|nr:cyclic nucleotide-binding domain-containing protein [Actinomycetota bacterium]